MQRHLGLSLWLAVASFAVVSAQAPQTPAPAAGGQAPAARGGRGGGDPQGGAGPIKVMFVTKGHAYDREGLAVMLDKLGKEISWSHVEHPAATAFFDPALAERFDVFLFFDAIGRARMTRPDGSIYFEDPGPAAKKNLRALMQAGTKGMVFLHHSIASWNHTWPEYSEMVGGACDWGNPVTFQGG